MSKVSVIIPVYNVEQYIQRCVDSVIRQSLSDIEIILVDDGSTDKSGEVCDEYASMDNRIFVVHKKNEGLSCARNVGIELAHSDYIMFVDSDDWVEQSFCELPFTCAKKENADIVFFSHNRVNCEENAQQLVKADYAGVLSEQAAIRFNSFVGAYAWEGIYRKRLFDNIKFPVGKKYEDLGCTHRLIHKSSKTIYIQEPLYNYRIGRKGSITSTLDNNTRMDRKEMTITRIKDFREWGFDDYACKDAFNLLIWHGFRCDNQKYYVGLVNETPKSVLKDYSMKMRLLFFVFRLCRPLFEIICILLGRRKTNVLIS